MNRPNPPSPMIRLIQALGRLPGIGEKTASRLSLFLLRDRLGVAQEIITALTHLKEKVKFCQGCQNLTEETLCSICRDASRDRHILCVVQEPVDLLAIEKTGDYKGLYHILHGAFSPLEGTGPEDLHLDSLLLRLKTEGISEVILATNPTAEGETTALYLKKALTPFQLKITRIASGVPVGSILEYTDSHTLSRALTNRLAF